MTEATESSIVGLLNAQSKRDLERYARSLVVKKMELANLLTAARCGLLPPFLYRRHRRDFVPPSVDLSRIKFSAIKRTKTDQERDEFRKANGMIGAHFSERRLVIGHMLFTPDRSCWHFLYLDQRDLEPEGNHWSGGPHIHLLNYLWPTMDPDSLWTQFTGEERPHMGGALHVRFDYNA